MDINQTIDTQEASILEENDETDANEQLIANALARV